MPTFSQLAIAIKDSVVLTDKLKETLSDAEKLEINITNLLKLKSDTEETLKNLTDIDVIKENLKNGIKLPKPVVNKIFKRITISKVENPEEEVKLTNHKSDRMLYLDIEAVGTRFGIFASQRSNSFRMASDLEVINF